MNKDILKIYAITDRAWLKDGEHLSDKVEEAIAGGASIIQLREKVLKGEELKALALSVKQVCNAYGIPLIINDDVELAREIDADGVHVGQSDMGIIRTREILGQDKIIGATAKTVEQARKAFEEGADYLGSGAVFGSTTKTDAKPMTKELLEEICESVPIPVVAIGGIDETNAAKLKGLPIAGIAVVSGIFARKNVRRAAATLGSLMYGRPVVHCITNYVTVNDVANLILSMDASPIMAHHISEVDEVQISASALMINLGATDDYEAVRLAAKRAVGEEHPIVIDPVGIGVSTYRREFLLSLLEEVRPSCIRGNYSEIRAILENRNTLKGLDDDSCNDSSIEECAVKLAKAYNMIVVASGKKDIITDGSNTYIVDAGDEYQRRITGSGCMLSAAITAVFVYSGVSAASAAYTCRLMGECAATAAGQTIEEAGGSMSFRLKWLDEISK